jgi:peptidoglycan/xylan/chitin deacetylase (PgdA/CDA1 family)
LNTTIREDNAGVAGEFMRLVGAFILSGALVASGGFAKAVDCTNPDALGVSRTLKVDPAVDKLLGTIQYRNSLPLEDHEVVLTFDDGPLPRYSNAILDILAAECVTATYFMVGDMAREFPSTVRKIAAAGHTIGTHSQSHPMSFDRMPIERARRQIEDGISSVSKALGETAEVAPFFRIPGLARQSAVEKYLLSRNLSVFSADVTGDDWRRIRAREVVKRTMRRLEARGRGIILLHDIHAVTVMALPPLLRELKSHGYRVVHLTPMLPEPEIAPPNFVPLPPERPKPTDPDSTPVAWDIPLVIAVADTPMTVMETDN